MEKWWFERLQRSWYRMCEDFKRGDFFPESENDITCYLYYSLVVHEGIMKTNIHTEYSIEGYHIDLVLGEIRARSAKVADKPLLVEIKMRKGRVGYYLDHYYSHDATEKPFVGVDAEKLLKLRDVGRGVSAAFFQKAPSSPKLRKGQEILQDWERLQSTMIVIKDRLRSNGIELLYGP